ncbi:MAG: HipA domain-containing protein [Zoogloea sp.]|nr:HipA domain-containing protein [Zoogloea sp.]
MTGNIDDHLRNHGFLRVSQGWRLAPAYDLNPTHSLLPNECINWHLTKALSHH